MVSIKIVILISFLIVSFSKKENRAQVEKVCKDTGSQYSSETLKYSTVNEYVEYLTEKQSNKIDMDSFFINLITKGEVSNFSSLLNKIIFYLIIIIIGVLIVFTFPAFYICWCCHCCLFKKKPGERAFAFITYIISMVLLSLMVISSIVGFVYSSRFVKHFNGSTCFFLNFFHHGLNGDERVSLPRWVGTEVISLTLNGATLAIDEIIEENGRAFQNHNSKITAVSQNYENAIKGMNSFYSAVSNINNDDTIYTSYAKQYQDYNDNDTYIGKTYTEYKTIIFPIIEALDGLKRVSESITSGVDSVKKGIQDLDEDIKNLDDTIEEVSDSVTVNFVNFQNTVDDIIVLIFRIVLGIFFIISASTMALITMNYFYRFGILKCFVHITWNVLIFFVMLSFILGGLLGAVYIIVKELVPAISYVLSPSYLQSGFNSNSEAAEAINSCLNGDGQLTKVFKTEGSDVDLLNSFYFFSIIIEVFKEALKNVNTSTILTTIDSELKKIKDDFSLATSPENEYGNDSISHHLTLLNELISSNCQVDNIKDMYVTNKESCPSSYTYLTSSSSVTKGNKNCLNIQMISSPPSYYTSSICNNKGNNIINEITNIKTFITNNIGTTSDSISLSKLIDENNNLKLQYETLLQNIKEEIEGTGSVTHTIINIIEPIVGKNDFYDMFNCGFIKNDLIMFFDQFMNKFASDSLGVALSCIISSTFVYISIYFILISFYRTGSIKQIESNKNQEINKTENVPNINVPVNNQQKSVSEIKETDKILGKIF